VQVKPIDGAAQMFLIEHYRSENHRAALLVLDLRAHIRDNTEHWNCESIQKTNPLKEHIMARHLSENFMPPKHTI
jgi:hypothetical protein